MAPFTCEAHDFHKKVADSYISSLQESGVENVELYFEEVNAFEDGRITEEGGVREFLGENDLPLEIFYRVAPTGDQDVLMATLNPGMQKMIDRETFTNGEYGRHRLAGKDLEAKAETVATNINGYLTRQDNSFKELIDILRSELDIMDSSGTLEEYVTCSEDDLFDGFFGDVCYTWPYKLATPKDYHVDDLGGPSRTQARNWFAKELFEIVDPKVLVCVGKQGWQTVWASLDEPEEEIEAYSDNSPVTVSYNSTFGEGAYAGLYRIESKDLWVITTWHAGMWIKSGRLRDNAQTLNEEI